MELILSWIILSILVGYYASTKGRSGIGFALIALIISPLIGFIIALIVKNKEENLIEKGDAKKCPHCKELIKVDATNCKYCGKSTKKRTIAFQNTERTVERKLSNDTYYITVKNQKDSDFKEAKDKLTLQYEPYGYDTVAKDDEKGWKLKSSSYEKSYIQVIERTDELKIEIFNVQNEPTLFIEDIILEDDSSHQINNTDRLIELSKLLEKDLITREEFDKKKKDLI